MHSPPPYGSTMQHTGEYGIYNIHMSYGCMHSQVHLRFIRYTLYAVNRLMEHYVLR